ncbi:MAG: hypothetical protein WBG08_13650, partial [Litorimonas sp.]
AHPGAGYPARGLVSRSGPSIGRFAGRDGARLMTSRPALLRQTSPAHKGHAPSRADGERGAG